MSGPNSRPGEHSQAFLRDNEKNSNHHHRYYHHQTRVKTRINRLFCVGLCDFQCLAADDGVMVGHSAFSHVAAEAVSLYHFQMKH